MGQGVFEFRANLNRHATEVRRDGERANRALKAHHNRHATIRYSGNWLRVYLVGMQLAAVRVAAALNIKFKAYHIRHATYSASTLCKTSDLKRTQQACNLPRRRARSQQKARKHILTGMQLIHRQIATAVTAHNPLLEGKIVILTLRACNGFCTARTCTSLPRNRHATEVVGLSCCSGS